MHSRTPLLITALGLVFGTGCSTLSVQRAALDGVKTVAVVGYTANVRLRDPNDGSGGGVMGMVNNANAVADMSSGEAQQKRLAQATETYDLLRAKVSEGSGWTVLSRDEVLASPAYRQAFTEHRSAFAGMSQSMGDYRVVPEMLMHHTALELTQAERNALMDELRVDALVMVAVNFVPGKQTGFSMGIFGKTGVLPKAVVDLTMYDRTSPEPIWRDNAAEGQPASVGVETTMGYFNDDQLLNGMTEAAQSAYDVLMQRYRSGG